MDVSGVFIDAFGRIRDTAHGATEGLSDDELTERLDDEANTIVWLLWHLSRIEDDHVSAVAGRDQVWVSGDWVSRLALPFSVSDTGYGHSADAVAAVTCGADLLLGYQDAVHDHCVEYLETVTGNHLDRIVDRRWDPPVTLGVRLVSVVNDALEHVGQAAFVRGILLRRRVQ